MGRAASGDFVALASGYPLHHLRAFISFTPFGGSATIPLATLLLQILLAANIAILS
jgi:hypothetical protein